MPEDVGGQPFRDGEEPDDRHHGDADEEFAAVVFDEDFVRAAQVHEPTAAERTLAAAQSHAETEVARPYDDGYVYGPGGEADFDPDLDGDFDGEFDDDPDDDPDDRNSRRRSPRGASGTTHGYGRGYRYRYRHGRLGGYRYDDSEDREAYDGADEGHGDAHERDAYDEVYGRYGPGARPYRSHVRWQRPVAWVLAVVMGVGMVALAFAAVYRGASGQRNEPAPPPATSGVGAPAGEAGTGARGDGGVERGLDGAVDGGADLRTAERVTPGVP